MDRNAKSVIYNWYASNENGEEFTRAETGKHGVTRIKYHEPAGEGDRHYCDIYEESGYFRVFNLCCVDLANE